MLAMRKTMSRNIFADWVNACGYLQIVQNALTKGTYEDRTSGLWKQALVCRTEKQKRRFIGFLNKIALKDSTFRHLSILTDDERKKMAMAFLQVGERSDPWLAIRCASMYFYIDGMWTRAEDPRNRTLSDLHAFEYPPSGRTGLRQDNLSYGTLGSADIHSSQGVALVPHLLAGIMDGCQV